MYIVAACYHLQQMPHENVFKMYRPVWRRGYDLLFVTENIPH